MNKKLLNRKPHLERTGAASVEFAVVFPVIIVFFVGVVVFAQAFSLKDTAQHAAYEGAREGLKLETSADQCEQKVNEFLTSMRLTGATVTIEPANLNMTSPELTVTVSIPFSENAWLGAGFMPDNWRAASSIRLRRFNAQN